MKLNALFVLSVLAIVPSSNSHANGLVTREQVTVAATMKLASSYNGDGNLISIRDINLYESPNFADKKVKVQGIDVNVVEVTYQSASSDDCYYSVLVNPKTSATSAVKYACSQ